MRLITCHKGQLQELLSGALPSDARAFVTGLPAIDALLPPAGLAAGAVHEILSKPTQPIPITFALLLAVAAMTKASPSNRQTQSNPATSNPAANPHASAPSSIPWPASFPNPSSPAGAIVWSDPQRTLHPPALAAAGTPLEALYLIRPQTPDDEVWAVAECLRCKGVAAVIAAPPRLTRTQARRLQLAAEAGAGVGILLRPHAANVYAAATRWLVAPAPGQRTVQRWQVQLIHGHGGRLEHPVFLEKHRETNSLRALEQLAHRHPRQSLPEKRRA